ncbi:hypothetical protein ACFO0N_20885 [Halobium salinum]|uniref:Uncharacterized protein n=1 Tax=Halobium salinum TaxID=1364940 RepID=A0ABD5PHS0_9EURY|nr:hypothetical protein [Halobium salinum]
MDITDTNDIELSRGEAQTVVAALAEYETTAQGTEEESVVSIRRRFEEEYDLGGGDDGDGDDGTPTSSRPT